MHLLADDICDSLVNLTISLSIPMTVVAFDITAAEARFTPRWQTATLKFRPPQPDSPVGNSRALETKCFW